MKHIIRLGKTIVELQARDLDGDGIVGGVERISQDNLKDVLNTKESSEMGDILSQMNMDEMNKEGLSSIDFMTNTQEFQVVPLVANDSLVAMNFIQKEAGFIGRVLKRNLISVGAMGRRDFVDVTTRKESPEDRSMGSRMKNLFGANNKE